MVFTFKGARDVQGPNYRAARGEIEVTKYGRVISTLTPEKRSIRHRRRP